MDGAVVPYQDYDDLDLSVNVWNHQHPTQAQLDAELMPSDDEFNLQQPTQAQLDAELMLSDDEFNPTPDNTPPDNLMPFEDEFDIPPANPAQQNDFELDIPHYLPDHALVTDSASLAYADGHEERYLTVLNTPIDNYVAQKINDGHEFAIGGDPRHILASLDREFGSQPQQRWHVIVVPEDNLQLVGAPRRVYPLVSGVGDGRFQSAEEGDQAQRNMNHGENLMNSGTVNAPQYDGGNTGFLQPGQLLQNGGFNENGMIERPNELVGQSSDPHGSRSQPNCDYTQNPSTPCPTAPAQSNLPRPPTFSEHHKRKRLRRESMDRKRAQQEEEENKQKAVDAATIQADDRFGNYTGTNLCRWCGRRGHEAVHCIKWDSKHFDKLVCVACNNKKHLIDECTCFAAKPIQERVKLLLVDGANKPGVRSFFHPWVCTRAVLLSILEIWCAHILTV